MRYMRGQDTDVRHVGGSWFRVITHNSAFPNGGLKVLWQCPDLVADVEHAAFEGASASS